MARTAKKKTAKKAVKKIAKKAAKTAAKRRPNTLAKRSAGKSRKLAAFTGGHSHPDDQICGCDLDIRDADSTPDDMLPAARGGVEKAA